MHNQSSFLVNLIPFSSIGLDNSIGRCFPPLSKSSQDSGYKTPQPKRRVPTNRSPPSDSDGSMPNSVKKGSPLRTNDRNSTSTTSCNVDHPKKPSQWKIEIAVPSSASSKVACEDNDVRKNDSPASESGENERPGNSKLETKHAVFSKIYEEKMHKFGGLKSGSRVVPFDDSDQNLGSDGVDPKDVEDLSKIREQLIQIENQQSSLLDLLQVCTDGTKLLLFLLFPFVKKEKLSS